MKKNKLCHSQQIPDNLEDKKHFQEAMRDVIPLVNNNVILSKTFPTSKFSSDLKLDLDNNTIALDDNYIHNITSEEKLFFARTGLQQRALQKLKQGKIQINAAWDLHGLTVNQARKTIEKILKDACAQQYKYIHIIHGKGKSSQTLPVLKNHLNHWLRQIPAVLAFCSALPKDGGTGALYILLKNSL